MVPPAPQVLLIGGEAGAGAALAERLRAEGVAPADWRPADAPHVIGPGTVAVALEPDPQVLRELADQAAGVVAVVAHRPSPQHEATWLLAGADAVVVAGTGPDPSAEATHRLAEAVAAVGAGEAVVAPDRLRLVLDRARLGVPGGGEPLTPREAQILASIHGGDTVKGTAARLGIAPKTVENLQSKLFAKLRARNRVEAVERARELGLLEGLPSSPPV